MNLDEQEQTLMTATKEMLDRSAEDLDPRTLARLRQARNHALEAHPRTVRWIWAGGFAAAAVATLAGVLWFSKPAAVLPVHDFDEFELVTTTEAFDFYDELEFYRWLATHDSAG